MQGFNVMALNANYELIGLVRSTNLQWTRKYYESGTFSLQIPLEQYNSDVAYIYAKDRQEMGVVTQINYVNKKGYRNVQLSGYFLENELNNMIVFPKGVTNIVNGPDFASVEGYAEDVAYTFFNAFKQMLFVQGQETINVGLDINSVVSKARGKKSIHTRNGEKLGAKIYDILKPSEMSYRVKYDFEANKKVFEVWQGLDRTEEQTENNPVVFSTRYGNIKNPNILIDNTDYKNGYIVVGEYTVNDVKNTYVRAVQKEPAEVNSYIYVKASSNKADYATDAEYYAAIESEGREASHKFASIINVEFDAMEGSYEYMKDFDIGDLCNLEIPEINISAKARLINCYEVYKGSSNSLSLEFGTPILK